MRAKGQWSRIKNFILESCLQHTTQTKAAEALPDGEICPYYKTRDMVHVGDGLGIAECTCKGRPGKLPLT